MTDSASTPTVTVRDVAFVRTGDKGDTLNVGVVPFKESDFDDLARLLTIEVIRDTFGEIVKGDVTRYEFPGIRALNFVLTHAMDGGVSRSITLDEHGKQKQSLVADIELPDWPRPIDPSSWADGLTAPTAG